MCEYWYDLRGPRLDVGVKHVRILVRFKGPRLDDRTINMWRSWYENRRQWTYRARALPPTEAGRSVLGPEVAADSPVSSRFVLSIVACGADQTKVSTRILGRHTAPFPPFLIS